MIKPTGEHPVPRYTYTASLYQNEHIVVIAGCRYQGVCNETSFLSLESKELEPSFGTISFKWKQIITSGAYDLDRSGHTANICKDILYLFGGADKEEESTNELWMLDLVDFKWSCLSVAERQPGKPLQENSLIRNRETLWSF